MWRCLLYEQQMEFLIGSNWGRLLLSTIELCSSMVSGSIIANAVRFLHWWPWTKQTCIFSSIIISSQGQQTAAQKIQDGKPVTHSTKSMTTLIELSLSYYASSRKQICTALQHITLTSTMQQEWTSLVQCQQDVHYTESGVLRQCDLAQTVKSVSSRK